MYILKTKIEVSFAQLETIVSVRLGLERVYVFVLHVIRKRLAQPLPMVTDF